MHTAETLCLSFDIFQEFFKNRTLTSETSDSDFCDLVEELFHTVNLKFFEKNQYCRSYFKVQYNIFI